MEFTINKTVYRSGKLDAFAQLHIVRRLIPCLPALASIVKSKVKIVFDKQGKPVDIDGDLNALLVPLTNAASALKDEDVEFVLNACLEATEKKRANGGWTRLRVEGVTMVDDISLPAMFQIAYNVVMENMTDFFADLPSLSGLGHISKAKA